MPRTNVARIQNLCLQSEALNISPWTIRGTATVLANQFVSPAGTLTGDRVTVGGVGSDVYQVVGGGVTDASHMPSIWLTGVSTVGTLRIMNPGAGNLGEFTVPMSLLPIDGSWLRVYPGAPGTTIVTPFTYTANGVSGFHFVSVGGGAITFGAWGAQIVNVANWPGDYVKTEAATVNTGPIRSRALVARTGVARVQNLLIYSEAIGGGIGGWAINNATVTANNAIAPDGTLTASRVVCDGTTINQGAYTNPSALTVGVKQTVSIYLKGLVGGEQCQIGDASNRTFVVLTTNWQRFSTPYSQTVSAPAVFYALNNTAQTFYAWGAQVVNTNWPGNYVKTEAAAVNTGPIRLMSARVQNLMTWSEDFSTWDPSSCTVTVNTAIAPDGTMTADTLQATAGSGFVIKTIGASLSPKLTLSLYVKSLSGTQDGQLLLYDSTASAYVSTPVATIPFTATTSWQKISGTWNIANPGNTFRGVIRPAGAGTGSIYAWGAQMVQANWPGEYVKTEAAAVDTGPIRSRVI